MSVNPFMTEAQVTQKIQEAFSMYVPPQPPQPPIVTNEVANYGTFTHIKSGGTILLDGASFADSRNGWFEMMCTDLGLTANNSAVGGSHIGSLAKRLIDETLFTQSVLNNSDSFLIMHTFNYDVYELEDLTINGNTITKTQFENFSSDDYENLNWNLLTNGVAPTQGGQFAAIWDFVLKKLQRIYYAERLKSSSDYYQTTWGKPFNVVLATDWHDGRTAYNDSIRKLAVKWGLPLVEFDINMGWSRDVLHSSGVQHSILYALQSGGNPETQTIDGQLFAWHYRRGASSPIVKRMAAIAKNTFKII